MYSLDTLVRRNNTKKAKRTRTCLLPTPPTCSIEDDSDGPDRQTQKCTETSPRKKCKHLRPQVRLQLQNARSKNRQIPLHPTSSLSKIAKQRHQFTSSSSSLSSSCDEDVVSSCSDPSLWSEYEESERREASMDAFPCRPFFFFWKTNSTHKQTYTRQHVFLHPEVVLAAWETT